MMLTGGLHVLEEVSRTQETHILRKVSLRYSRWVNVAPKKEQQARSNLLRETASTPIPSFKYRIQK